MVKWWELEDREPIINIPPFLSCHPKRICDTDRFLFQECWKRVRGCYATWQSGCTQIAWIYENLSGNQELGNKDCVFSLYDKMSSICPGVCQIYTPNSPVQIRYPCISVCISVAQSVSLIPVSAYPTLPASPCQR